LSLEKGMLPNEEVYLDSYATYEVPAGGSVTQLTTTEIPHIANLEGQTVRVTIRVKPPAGSPPNEVPASLPLIPVSGLTIDLPQAFGEGTVFEVGLPYIGKLTTLPMDQVGKEGSAMVWKKRWNRIVLRVFESGVPRLNGQLLPVINPSTPMGYGQPLRTTDLSYRNLGWDDTGMIRIEQIEPVRTQILGIFGEAAFDTL
jgi:hypothetical protein